MASSPQIEGWSLQENVGVVVLVGQDKSNNPATLEYTQSYKDDIYPGAEAVTIVADPNWDIIRQNIAHPSLVNFPLFAVLDAQMNLLYVGSEKNVVSDLVGAVSQ